MYNYDISLLKTAKHTFLCSHILRKRTFLLHNPPFQSYSISHAHPPGSQAQTLPTPFNPIAITSAFLPFQSSRNMSRPRTPQRWTHRHDRFVAEQYELEIAFRDSRSRLLEDSARFQFGMEPSVALIEYIVKTGRV